MRHRSRFLTFSALALLYPVGAVLYMFFATPAGVIVSIGYGLANLGYVLLVAGIATGTFAVLGLSNRWHVLGLAAVSWLAGTLLVNVGLWNLGL